MRHVSVPLLLKKNLSLLLCPSQLLKKGLSCQCNSLLCVCGCVSVGLCVCPCVCAFVCVCGCRCNSLLGPIAPQASLAHHLTAIPSEALRTNELIKQMSERGGSRGGGAGGGIAAARYISPPPTPPPPTGHSCQLPGPAPSLSLGWIRPPSVTRTDWPWKAPVSPSGVRSYSGLGQFFFERHFLPVRSVRTTFYSLFAQKLHRSSKTMYLEFC